MPRRQLHPSLDALYAGRCTRGELEEYENYIAMRPLRPYCYDDEDTAPPPKVVSEPPLAPLLYLGQPRKFLDTKCRCDRPLPYVDWNGYDQPLEQWCFHCGRVMPRPYDARFPLSEADRALALPTVEVGIVAEAVS